MFHMTISLLLCQFRASANSLSTTHCKSQKNSLAQLSQWPASVPPASPRTSRSGLRPQACTLHEEGKEGLARARKQQRYSALVFAQTQRISSMALKSNARDESTLYTLYSLLSPEIQICPGTWLGAAPGAAAGLTAAMKPPPNLAVCI